MSTICRLQRRPKINSGAVSSAGNKFCEEDIEYRTTVDLTLGAKDLEFSAGHRQHKRCMSQMPPICT